MISIKKAYIFSIYDFPAFTEGKMVQETPKIAPRRPKRPPRGPQDGPRERQDGPSGPQDGPREPQEDPKRGTRGGIQIDVLSLPPQDGDKSPNLINFLKMIDEYCWQ